MTQTLNDLGRLPGMEGAAWRLVKHWNPDGIGAWLQIERLRNTPPQILAEALADVMASSVMAFGDNMNDPREAIVGDQGVVKAFQNRLQLRINQRTGQAPRPHIIRPGSA